MRTLKKKNANDKKSKNFNYLLKSLKKPHEKKNPFGPAGGKRMRKLIESHVVN